MSPVVFQNDLNLLKPHHDKADIYQSEIDKTWKSVSRLLFLLTPVILFKFYDIGRTLDSRRTLEEKISDLSSQSDLGNFSNNDKKF